MVCDKNIIFISIEEKPGKPWHNHNPQQNHFAVLKGLFIMYR